MLNISLRIQITKENRPFDRKRAAKRPQMNNIEDVSQKLHRQTFYEMSEKVLRSRLTVMEGDEKPPNKG